MITFSSDLFVWTGNTGVCEVSDLPFRDHSIYEPFNVKSSKTDKVIRFHFLTTLFTADGSDREVIGWRFTSVDFVIDILND